MKDFKEDKMTETKYFEYERIVDIIQQAEDSGFEGKCANGILITGKNYLLKIVNDRLNSKNGNDEDFDFCTCRKCGKPLKDK